MKEDSRVILIMSVVSLIVTIASALFLFNYGPSGFAVESVAASFSVTTTLGGQEVTTTLAPSVPSGGGVSGKKTVSDFSIMPYLLQVTLKTGEGAKDSVNVKNIGDNFLDIIIEIGRLSNYISLSKGKIFLKKDESEDIIVNFLPQIDLGVVNGEILFIADNIIKKVNVLIEIESRQIIYDAMVDIPAEYRRLKIGDDLIANIRLINLGARIKNDVEVRYIIRNSKGDTIIEKVETRMVEDEVSYVKTFGLPVLNEGDYLLIAQVKYSDSFAVSSQFFEITKIEKPVKIVRWDYIIAASIVLLLIIILLVMWYYSNRRLRKVESSLEKRKFRKEINEIVRRRDKAKEIKFSIEGVLNKAINDYKNRMINYEQYSRILKEDLNGRNRVQWVRYYNDYINKCNVFIKNLKKK